MCLWSPIIKFSIPSEFYSDRNTTFESELFECLMFELKIKKLRTAEYNPRANELKEKSNECLKNFLTSHTKFSGENRDRWTREAAFAYNSSVHISSTFTLPKVMFGREYRVLIDVLSRFAKKKRNVRTFKILNVRGSIGRYYDKKVSESSCVKSIRIRSYSGPYFPAFGLNTERYSVSLCIKSKCGKMRTRITPNTDIFTQWDRM